MEYADVAQLAEQLICNQQVIGSSPIIGFTLLPEIFQIFPSIIQDVFAENCVAVVFVLAILLNLILPENMDIEKAVEAQE